MAPLRVGDRASLKDGRQGVVRYIGGIAAASGEFVGLELDTPTGKNDGTAAGQRYFTCPPNKGLFINSASVTKLEPPPSRSTTGSATQRASVGKAPVRTTLKRPSISSAGPAKPSSSRPSRPSSLVSLQQASQASTSKPQSAPTAVPSSNSTTTTSTAARRVSTTARAPNVDNLHLKQLERQLAEAREKIKEVDHAQAETARLQGLLQKLTNKHQAAHAELVELRTSAKAKEEEIERLKRLHEEDLEAVALDKEMAEVKAENAEAELESLRRTVEDQRLDLEIRQEEEDELIDEVSGDGKQGAVNRRLVKENLRLRDAIIALREVSEEKEADLTSQVRELQSDIEALRPLENTVVELQQRVEKQAEIISDLRQQLDDANTAEDLIEDLSTQNHSLQDKIEEQTAAIEDLEALQELSNELEIQHAAENEELRAELDARDIEVAEQREQILRQEANITELESVITKYRDVYNDVQIRMREDESSRLLSQDETRRMEERLHEAMEANRRLHSSHLASTVKHITAARDQMKRVEAEEELSIVKLYVKGSSESFNGSLRAYFCAKRISFEADLSSSVILKNSATGGTKDDVQFSAGVFRCRVVAVLSHLCLKGTRYSAAVSSSNLYNYGSFAANYLDMLPIQKTIEEVLEAIKVGDLDYAASFQNLKRSESVLDDILAAHSLDLGQRPQDEIVFRVSMIKVEFTLIQTCLQTAASSLEFCDIEDARQHATRLSTACDRFTQHVAASDRLSKILNNLREDSLYPKYSTGLDEFRQLEERAADLSRRVADAVLDLQVMFQPDNIGLVKPRLEDVLDVVEGVDYTAALNNWKDFASVLMNCVEFERPTPPWVSRSIELQAEQLEEAKMKEEYEHELQENRKLQLQLRELSEDTQTKSLKIEHLEAKYRLKEAELQKSLLDIEQRQHDFEEYKAHAALEMENLQRQTKVDTISDEEKAKIRAAMEKDLEQSAPPHKKAEPQTINETSFASRLSAIENENHWLRRRENAEALEANLADIKDTATNTRLVAELCRSLERGLDGALSVVMDLDELKTLASSADALEPPKTIDSVFLYDFTLPAIADVDDDVEVEAMKALVADLEDMSDISLSAVGF